MALSFFANRNGSGEIRGRQIAAYLGARLNPTDDYEDDVCVWVKRQPPEDHPPRTYLDIVDAQERIAWLKHHPEVGVIASSASGVAYLERLGLRSVVLIPQHHANIDRIRKAGSMYPLRVGVVGGAASMPEPFRQALSDALAGSLNTRRPTVQRYECRTRGEVIAAYEQIDVQVVWRGIQRPLKNPLKIINAASFGIPTIALPEVGYEEVADFYWPARSVREVLAIIEALTVNGWNAERLIAMSEAYHIEPIGRLYEEILT